MKKKEETAINLPQRFTVIAADLSLNRPGFAKVRMENGKAMSVETYCVDNKTNPKHKPRGQILNEIVDVINDTLNREKDGRTFRDPVYLVREASINNAAFGRRSGTAARTGISEVVGVADLIAWQHGLTWNELYPVTVKKQITGSGKATKEEVAAALTKYAGEHTYACDDESDAAAVAFAWLIQSGIIRAHGKEEETGS